MYTQINIIMVGIISLGKESIHAVVHLLHSSSKKNVSLGDRCPHPFSVLSLLSTFSETIQFSGSLSLSLSQHAFSVFFFFLPYFFLINWELV